MKFHALFSGRYVPFMEVEGECIGWFGALFVSLFCALCPPYWLVVSFVIFQIRKAMSRNMGRIKGKTLEIQIVDMKIPNGWNWNTRQCDRHMLTATIGNLECQSATTLATSFGRFWKRNETFRIETGGSMGFEVKLSKQRMYTSLERFGREDALVWNLYWQNHEYWGFLWVLRRRNLEH